MHARNTDLTLFLPFMPLSLAAAASRQARGGIRRCGVRSPDASGLGPHGRPGSDCQCGIAWTGAGVELGRGGV